MAAAPALILVPPVRQSRGVEDLDEATVERARRGDHAAFRDVVVRYQRPVHALLGRVLPGVASAAMIEELAQEVFLRVYRGLPAFVARGPGRLRKWILTIAMHLAIDLLRERRLPEQPFSDQQLEGAARADEVTTRRSIGRAIERAVAALPEEQRVVFLLREYEGFDYDDIARTLGIDLGTVKSRLFRARAALRTALSEVNREG